jgi:hypothetical protein
MTWDKKQNLFSKGGLICLVEMERALQEWVQ